jgi:hypothetical protein
LEITLDVAKQPHRAQFTARFSDPAPWQRTSVTAWHFLQRYSKSGIVLFKTSAPNGARTQLNYSTPEKNVKSSNDTQVFRSAWDQTFTSGLPGLASADASFSLDSLVNKQQA